MPRKVCPICGAYPSDTHRESVRRAKIIVRIARGAGLLRALRTVVAAQLENTNAS